MAEEAKPEQKPPEEFVLQIKLAPGGEIKLEGNVINNEPLALYLLEKGKDMVKIHCAELARSAIVKPRGGIMDFARKRRI